LFSRNWIVSMHPFAPLEIMPRCSTVPPVAGLDSRTIPAGLNAWPGFLTGFAANPMNFDEDKEMTHAGCGDISTYGDR
jgi:hypothetical protein